MRRSALLPALIALAGCAHQAAAPRQAEAPPETAALSAPGAPPMPVFEIQPNWVIVRTDAYDKDTVAVVTLARGELAGMMRLEIMKDDCGAPAACAARMRSETGRIRGMTTSDPPGADTDTEAGYRWQRQETKADGSPDEPTHGQVLFRRIPGHPEMMALCEGWWPESTMDFLVSPLHAACASVRLPR